MVRIHVPEPNKNRANRPGHLPPPMEGQAGQLARHPAELRGFCIYLIVVSRSEKECYSPPAIIPYAQYQNQQSERGHALQPIHTGV